MQRGRNVQIPAARLHAMGSELGRLAERIAELTRSPTEPGEPTSEMVRGILKARQLRADHLGDDLFADPAWDMLLDLFASTLEGRDVTVSSLCVASRVPHTTALRWVTTLEQRGMVVRERSAT